MRRYSNKSLLLLLHLTLPYTLVFFLSGCGSTADSGGTASVSLTWNAPTLNEDGSPLTDLIGYRIHYGETSGTYTGSVVIFSNAIYTDSVTFTGNTTTVRIDELPHVSTLYFSVTALDLHGNESIYSNVIKVMQPATN